KIATGKLATLDNQIDTTTGTLKLRALFDNSSEELFPNQFVNIHLLLDTLHDQIVVPAAAIQSGASGSYVYLVNPDQTVSMHLVATGASDADLIAITKGLNVGDTVVVDGADQLRDGARVMVGAAGGGHHTASGASAGAAAAGGAAGQGAGTGGNRA